MAALMRIPVGTKVTCPRCSKVIGETVTEIVGGMMMEASLFKEISQSMRNGDRCWCDECHEYYFLNGSLHTENGWSR